MEHYRKKITEENSGRETGVGGRDKFKRVTETGQEAEAERKKALLRNIKAKRTVRFLLGLLESLLAIRLVLKLLGANPASGFARFIYGVTQVFLYPFVSIFRLFVTQGIETRSVLEPANVTGMIVYALIGWGIIKLIGINRDSV